MQIVYVQYTKAMGIFATYIIIAFLLSWFVRSNSLGRLVFREKPWPRIRGGAVSWLNMPGRVITI